MRARDPELYEEYVGQYMSAEEKLRQRQHDYEQETPAMAFSTALLKEVGVYVCVLEMIPKTC